MGHISNGCNGTVIIIVGLDVVWVGIDTYHGFKIFLFIFFGSFPPYLTHTDSKVCCLLRCAKSRRSWWLLVNGSIPIVIEKQMWRRTGLLARSLTQFPDIRNSVLLSFLPSLWILLKMIRVGNRSLEAVSLCLVALFFSLSLSPGFVGWCILVSLLL